MSHELMNTSDTRRGAEESVKSKWTRDAESLAPVLAVHAVVMRAACMALLTPPPFRRENTRARVTAALPLLHFLLMPADEQRCLRSYFWGPG